MEINFSWLENYPEQKIAQWVIFVLPFHAEMLAKEEEHATEKKEVSLSTTQLEEPMSQAMAHETAPATLVLHHTSDRVSNLELENKLLRKEVASLNEEMVSAVQRAKEAEKRKLFS